MIKTADDLFELNRNQLPNPNNPKPGDTYEHVVENGMFKLVQRIVVASKDENSTWYYVNGEMKGCRHFAHFIRSMKNIRVVLEA
jgi:hypothetical protein